MILYKDNVHNFYEIFNPETGCLLRSDVILDGKETTTPAPMRSFPELIDVGIMGHCHAAKSGLCKSFGIDCYQNGHSLVRKNLPLEKYKSLLDQCRNRVYQIVLGGAGDPIKHEKFQEILRLTKEANIIPNLTTTGFLLNNHETNLIKQYCGAVAVSFYSRLDACLNETSPVTLRAIQQLLDAKCRVNIHYVLSRETVSEATLRLKQNLFPKGINGVIFLLYKPIGEGVSSKALTTADSDYIQFLTVAQENNFSFRIGFDTCQTPALRKFCGKLNRDSIEPCEAARFSMYIDSNFKAYPCSFACHDENFQLDLNDISLFEAWNSSSFSKFRESQQKACSGCHQVHCYKCVLESDLNFCTG